MTVCRGTLVVKKNKGGNSFAIQGPPSFSISLGEVCQSILDKPDSFNGQEVEYDRVGGQPKKVRQIGKNFVAPATQAPPPARSSYQPNKPTFDSPQNSPSFHNPYNFIPTPPRNIDDPELGDCVSVPQDSFDKSRWSGSIRVHMEAITPILVPDTCNAKERDGHKIYQLLMKDGKPLIPASTVRGMLRSAYETVTNSRFGRFSSKQHGAPLVFRMGVDKGLEMIPARIEEGRVKLLRGTSPVGTQGNHKPLHAAWLLQYGSAPLTYPDGELPKHSAQVRCRLELCNRTKGKVKFDFWDVVAISPLNEPLQESAGRNRGSNYKSLNQFEEVTGFVCRTNRNIDRKHDERVFFDLFSEPLAYPLTPALKDKWHELIKNYQIIHKEDLIEREKRRIEFDKFEGSKAGKTEWSRHVYLKDALELTDESLCYARLTKNKDAIEALFPVMISREFYAASPWSIVDETIAPAASRRDLSPADRVFGWVSGDSNVSPDDRAAAIRGLLRVGPVRCETPAGQSMEQFVGDGVPLAILGAPKPQQARFYVGQSNGTAQENKLSKEQVGYSSSKRLRGRKVYPHHQGLPKDHWQWQQPTTASLHYREYLRQKDGTVRDGQNRSTTGWVKPGAKFTFDLEVMNLSLVELGALLWLLSLDENHFLKLGGGKPFGFGSVKLNIATIDLRSGDALVDRYRNWCSSSSAGSDPRQQAIKAFKKAIENMYTSPFDRVSFIKAFLRSCTGHPDQLRVHYPRTTKEPNPDGESFKWFVNNEKNQRLSLQDICNDALPLN